MPAQTDACVCGSEGVGLGGHTCVYVCLLCVAVLFFLLVYLFFVSLIDVLLCPCASRLSVHISVLARAIKQIISVSVLVFKASDPSWQQSNDAACLADRF